MPIIITSLSIISKHTEKYSFVETTAHEQLLREHEAALAEQQEQAKSEVPPADARTLTLVFTE